MISNAEIYNIGLEDQTNVKTIAETVTKEMKLKNVKFKFTGGVDGGRGWKGDVKNMLLDIGKLKTQRMKTQTSQPVVAVIPMPVANQTQVSV